MQNNKPVKAQHTHLYGKYSSRVGSCGKYSTRLRLVLYLPLNLTPRTVFSVYLYNIFNELTRAIMQRRFRARHHRHGRIANQLVQHEGKICA